MNMMYYAAFATFAAAMLSSAAPAAAQSDDLFLLCTKSSSESNGPEKLHVDVSFATQLVSLKSGTSSSGERYQNGLSIDGDATFANTSQSEISFGRDRFHDKDVYVIDRTNGQMTESFMSKVWATYSCERETVSTKF